MQNSRAGHNCEDSILQSWFRVTKPHYRPRAAEANALTQENAVRLRSCAALLPVVSRPAEVHVNPDKPSHENPHESCRTRSCVDFLQGLLKGLNWALFSLGRLTNLSAIRSVAELLQLLCPKARLFSPLRVPGRSIFHGALHRVARNRSRVLIADGMSVMALGTHGEFDFIAVHRSRYVRVTATFERAGELSRMVLLESERLAQTAENWTVPARHRFEFPGSCDVCRNLRRSERRKSQRQNERANACNPCNFPVHRFAPFPRAADEKRRLGG